MSKAFTKESNEANEPEKPDTNPTTVKNLVTPHGFSIMQDELRYLIGEERPKIVETVRWAAGNGDRSENGDYIYGKRRLREIDRRARYLTKRLETAEIVDPLKQKHLTKVFFGASVSYLQKDGIKKTVKIVGVDEADIEKGKISWLSPVAKALMKAEVGDVVELRTPAGVEILEIVELWYE